MEKPTSIGVFAGLLTSAGKIRLQRRVEKGSIIPSKTFKGDWELPGGKVKERDLKKALTLDVLQKELIREVKEELGIVIMHHPNPPLYLTIYENHEKGICDWAFMISIPTPPIYWDEKAKMKRETIDVNPVELRELADRPKGEQLLSGWGKRMCRMSLAALLRSPVDEYNQQARRDLDEVMPDWRKIEYFHDPHEDLAEIRRELGLEGAKYI